MAAKRVNGSWILNTCGPGSVRSLGRGPTHLTARAVEVVAMLLDPPAQILVDHREDARCRAPAHCDGRLDFRQDTVQGGRGEFGSRFGHWQGQEDSDVLAMLAFVKR